MKWKAPALAPVLITAGIIALVCAVEWISEIQPRFDFFRRLEWLTYDWRARQAAAQSPLVATNLGLVQVSDDSIQALLNGALPYRFGLHWPRQIHARLVNELATQGAKAVAFDYLFAELRPDPPARVGGKLIGSDAFFAGELRQAGNVILAAERELLPHEFFRTNSVATGDISAERDSDGILRRAYPYADVRVWHPLINLAGHELRWDLTAAQVEHDRIVFPAGQGRAVLPLGSSNTFDVAALAGQLGLTNGPVQPASARPFQGVRIWQMGIQMAARALQLDLDHAQADTAHRRIVLRGPGVTRVIPLDREGRFYIDWSITATNPALARESIEWLLDQYEARRDGRIAEVTNQWKDKLALVASTATGNDLTDTGATPLEPTTYLAGAHWNVANSVLMNRFIEPLGFLPTVLVIMLLGMTAGVCTWKLRTMRAVTAVAAISLAYSGFAWWAFLHWRLFIPIVLPVGGSLLVTHVSLMTWMVRVEQKERRRTKAIFSKIVSPDIVRELLDSEELPLHGARRRITVFFADIRGFTDATDASQQAADACIKSRGLGTREAAQFHDAQAAEMLDTVNLYLSAVAAEIKGHGGTLDKYIGDCVMAFWGAPVANPHHARDCVRAVIAAQRAIDQLNQQRLAENRRREEQNARLAAGEQLLPPLIVLTLGSGINTGLMTVGLMGSDAHLLNYTVFGREVNLASRLEGLSGSARILIGEQTHAELQRDAPELAALCRRHDVVTVKGFREAIVSYEVAWRFGG